MDSDESKELIDNLQLLRVNLLKEIYEIMGYDLDETNPNIKYCNYLIHEEEKLEDYE